MIFLFFTLLSVVIQGLFALFEMATLSMSRIRLEYYASSGNKRALWLHSLIQNPSRFFGTTLIGINAALQIGSECSRRFYESIHIDPDFAPITQVFLVVIFGELSPMFAARRHPSQLALALVPFMTLMSRLLLPLIWIFDMISRFVSRLVGKSKESPAYFSRDEVAIAFKEREDSEDELNVLTEQIFQFKNRTVGQIMIPLEKALSVSTHATFYEVSRLLKNHYEPFVLMYRHQKHQIVAVAQVRDLLRLEDKETIFEKSKSPWFVTQETSILEVLHQFRTNKHNVAVILDQTGKACGVLSLDHIVSQIFGRAKTTAMTEVAPTLYIERTLPGDMLVCAFNQEFRAALQYAEDDTLSDLIIKELGHPPVSGETVRLESFEFTVVEPTIRGVGTVSVCSVND